MIRHGIKWTRFSEMEATAQVDLWISKSAATAATLITSSRNGREVTFTGRAFWIPDHGRIGVEDLSAAPIPPAAEFLSATGATTQSE